MACLSDYQAPNEVEIEHSKVLALLQELKTGKLPKYFGDGMYDKVYNKSQETIGGERVIDVKTRELCTALKAKTPEEIKNYSLELQMWWRDHKKADKKRAKVSTKEKLRQQALSKLTDKEKKALGL